ncbi:hypothetical protein EVAR_84265_1 [Eumeta japonica]|uniref:Uncharacterized protein n=1 Tax=Eumeta variegata TaxID=151549 RepID=A0A4C1WR86_EUMVA|nr:hypothetical protein EVAR_84265_1 [Eumeta japonica]
MVTSGTAGSVRVATADARRHRRNGNCGWRPPTLVVTGAMVTSGTTGSVRVATADARRHRRNGNVRDRRLSAGGDRRRSSSPAQW